MNLRDLAAGDNPVLREIIADEIEENGYIPFSEFMRIALYHPQHGYYVTCDPSLDYQSSPNVHPVFGAALARQLVAFWQAMDRPAPFQVFEAGAGSGRLAADILRAVRLESPDCYESLAYVVQDQTLTPDSARGRLESIGLPDTKVGIAADLPAAGSFEGVVLSNELLDAIPFDRVTLRDGELREIAVGMQAGRFVDVEARSESAANFRSYFGALDLLPGEGCIAEVGLEAADWMRRAARSLRRGFILTLDYGYEADSLYAAWRRRGTLLTFYRHTSGEDPYVRVGRQDITASVDLTSLRRAGEAEGLHTVPMTTQTEFLASLGIAEALQQTPAAQELEAFYALRRAVMTLTDPQGLGRIRAMVQSKGID